MAIGAATTRWIPGGTLILATDLVLVALALRTLAGVRTPPAEVAPSTARVATLVAAVGIVAGLLGNSGGFLLVPVFVNGLRMPVRRAFGTSAALSAALAIPGTAVHAALGHVDWMITAVFALAMIPAASLGARAALRTRERTVSIAYGVALGILGSALLLVH
jgi:uncharacterized membrane protein YfcA